MEQAEKDRNLRVVAASHFMAGLFSSMTQAVWQPFVLSLGAPMSTLGMLESVGGARGIVTAFIQPIGGWLSDRLGRKPFIVLGSLAGFLAICFYVLAAISVDWRWLLPGIILLGAGLVALPAKHSLIAESTPPTAGASPPSSCRAWAWKDCACYCCSCC
jgi:MFS family permease